MCGVQLFMAVPMTMTLSAAVSDFVGRRYHRFVLIFRKNRALLSIQYIVSEKFIGCVIDTGEQFIGGVIDTGEQFMAVSLTSVITFFPGDVDTGQK
jgi:hypothetical protein